MRQEKEIFTIFNELQDIFGKSELILISAFFKENTIYEKHVNQFEALLNHPENSDLYYWMLGRLLVSAHLLNDTARVKQAYSELSNVTLSDQSTYSLKDFCISWGIAYLACYEGLTRHAHYDETKEVLTQIVASQYIFFEKTGHAAVNFFAWTVAMAIQASGFAKDESFYLTMRLAFMKLKPANNIAETLQLIDPSYPFWMRAILLNTARIFSDDETESSLKNMQQKFYQSAEPAALGKKVRDEVLAQATQEYFDREMQEETEKNMLTV